MKELLAGFAPAFQALHAQKPLLHHITNYVTVESCANAALCIGASPVMADAPEEMDAIVGAASALVLNLGTVNEQKFASMKLAAAAAHRKGIPIVLDPVGAMASAMRLRMSRELIADGVSVIKGNYAEIRTLLGDGGFGKGVDSDAVSDERGSFARQAAREFGCVTAVTGAADAVSDGEKTILAYNGHELLTKLTGTGCMTGTLIAAFAAVTDDYLLAALAGITAMNVAAEEAQVQLRQGEGPGSFKVRLFDCIDALTAEKMTAAFKGDLVNEIHT